MAKVQFARGSRVDVALIFNFEWLSLGRQYVLPSEQRAMAIRSAGE